MSEKVRVNEERAIIEIESYGVVSKEDILDALAQASHISDTKGLKKVFVDTTGQDKMPRIFDIYDIFSIFPRKLRFAVLVHKTQVTADDIFFAELVAVNRGAQIKLFHKKEVALSWLDKW